MVFEKKSFLFFMCQYNNMYLNNYWESLTAIQARSLLILIQSSYNYFCKFQTKINVPLDHFHSRLWGWYLPLLGCPMIICIDQYLENLFQKCENLVKLLVVDSGTSGNIGSRCEFVYYKLDTLYTECSVHNG